MLTPIRPAEALASKAMPERPVAELLLAAAAGDRTAWDAIVDRYIRLVWSVVRGFRLDDAACHDVVQTVWLRLLENLERIRDPDKLPGWLSTTTRNEALRVLRQQHRLRPTDFEVDVADPTAVSFDEILIDDETSRALIAAFGQMPEGCQQLLRLLTAEPSLDYEMISAIIDRPIGSIGPTRQRCLDRLRTLLAKHEGGIS